MSELSSKGSGALDAFLNLLSLITVGWLAWSFGAIIFAFIDHFFGSAQMYYNPQFGLKSGIASLIVITPVCLAVIGVLHRNYKQGTLSHESGIYRWLTYLMLLVSSLVIIGSLISIILQLLNGDYTLPSLLKVATVLIIALSIFGYHLYDLRRASYATQSLVARVAFAKVVVLALVAIVGGFLIVDSPQVTRMKNYDQERVNHLSQLSSAIDAYYFENKTLPADLSAPQFSSLTDPETNVPYRYTVVSDSEYQLCATFAFSANSDGEDRPWAGSELWYYHDAGEQCFSQKVQASPETLKPVSY